ncbi:MAG: molybdopterin-synthase adenylyltransferase [Solirubrobacteraceae bacterium]|nr:molybdopterin-synthase adenylyltransferase [Solirubrobacteraceae bacterium]
MSYRLRPGVELFFAASGDAYLLRPGVGDHVVRAPSASDRALLERVALGSVEAPDGSTEAGRLEPLVRAGVVVAEPACAPLDGDDAERFSRQLDYLAELGPPADVQRRLRGARVAVLGCGGLGTWALGAIASVGVARFVIVDDDAVELSNLNRQILYRAADRGQPKAELAAAWLRAFDPSIEVVARVQRLRSADDVAANVAGCDAVLVTADWPPYEITRWVNEACVALRVPFLTAGQAPPLLKIGPTYAPGAGPCFACHESELRAGYPLYAELAEHRARHPPPATTLGPASGVIGTLLGLEVLHLLAGDSPIATQGRALLMDMRTLEARWESVARDPRCPVCGGLFAAGAAKPRARGGGDP